MAERLVYNFVVGITIISLFISLWFAGVILYYSLLRFTSHDIALGVASITGLIIMLLPPLLSIFLIWKYITWKVIIKLLASIPTFLILLLFGFGIKDILSPKQPPIINQSKNYECKPINKDWGVCKSLKYNISFEYPVSWKYFDFDKGIKFSPSDEQLKNRNSVVLFEPYTSDKSADDLSKSAKEHCGKKYPGANISQVHVSDFYITTCSFKDPRDGMQFIIATIAGDKASYAFFSGLYQGIITEEELLSNFDHMINSVKRKNNF